MKLDHDEADTDVPHFPGQADGTFSCLSALPTLARMLVTPSYPTAAVLPVAADFTGDGFKDQLGPQQQPTRVGDARRRPQGLEQL